MEMMKKPVMKMNEACPQVASEITLQLLEIIVASAMVVLCARVCVFNCFGNIGHLM